jgi:ABC-type polysaccharide/polyol phosphate export permease
MELVRRPILEGQMPASYNVAVSVIFVSGLAALALVCLRKLERNVVFWV